jgi:hypothetical protein
VSSALALLMAVSGGLFGTLTALTIFFFIARAFVTHAIKAWVKGPHERNECPVCKRPMQHDHSQDEAH